MILTMNLGPQSYDIILEPGCLKKASELLNLNRKVFIVTDTGVPAAYAQTIAAQCKTPFIATVPTGEGSKSIEQYSHLLSLLLQNDFTRKDCVVAVGGGVVGDLAGFVAASFMRGIDFYNIPTTVLSQVDSSIGGKTAINLDGIKNIVGTFYQPKKVLIDVETLSSLSPRQFSNGLAEAVKMALTSDSELFRLFETEDVPSHISEIIERSLRVKKAVVEQDEKEQGLRKILNFGHTIGHGIESEAKGTLFHGECVAIGMLPMCSEQVCSRLLPVLEKLHLPTGCSLNQEHVFQAMLHDKKAADGKLTIIRVETPGTFEIAQVFPDSLREPVKSVVREAET